MATRRAIVQKSPARKRIPKEARKHYYEAYGKLLAHFDVIETKSATYGALTQVDRGSTVARLPDREGFTTIKRAEVYKKALSLYELNEIVRPAINLIASCIFPNGSPDFVGTEKKISEYCQGLIEYNQINFHDIAREGELAGDIFLWFNPDKEKTEIRSLDASVMESVLQNGNIRRLSGYLLKQQDKLPLERVQHLRFNSTSTSQYGRSSLRHLLYYLDVLDTLFEKNWLRGAQYYGNPLTVVTGIPGPFQDRVKEQIEAEIQRAGKSWVLPPDADVKVPDFSLNYPIKDIVDWVFRMISIGSEIPITLLGTADVASRGSAFYANSRMTLAIKPRREVWRIGLRQFFIKILLTNGVIPKYPSNREFDISFPPVFEKDLSDLADLVGIYRDRKLISKKSSRELVGLDHSDEEEYMKSEPKDEPMNAPPQDPVARLKNQAKNKDDES